MNRDPMDARETDHRLPKCPVGIKGLDEILDGGLPLGRPTLICGTAGCGKTLLASEFLVHGAVDYDEPGVFMAFEETQTELAQNLASLGIDLDDLITKKKIFVDYVFIDRSEIEETGEYDLEGLFIRLGSAIDAIGAKRVVLDTVETIFSGFMDENILRSELRRLFRWLKEKGVTAVITGERGSSSLTRHGLEEYVSDCVILLEHRVQEGIATRSLRVVKYRGSRHSNNEFPFLIDARGIWLLPITSVGLDYIVSREFISSGVPRLDAMLDGKGYFRGSSVLVSGTAGTGKTSLAAHLVDSTCRRGERCLYFAYEESYDQIIRNMRSIGIDLAQWVEKGLLHFHAIRPSFYGMEMHLLTNLKLTDEFKPSVVVMDPITNLSQIAVQTDVKTMLVRMIDFFKEKQITVLFTSLTNNKVPDEMTDVGISSLMDLWILLREMEINGERNRGLYVLKARGIAHSNQIREFLLTEHGIELIDVYVGPSGVLTGSARLTQEANERMATVMRQQEFDSKKRELERKRRALKAQIDVLQTQYEGEEEELLRTIAQSDEHEQEIHAQRDEMAQSRRADPIRVNHESGGNENE